MEKLGSPSPLKTFHNTSLRITNEFSPLRIKTPVRVRNFNLSKTTPKKPVKAIHKGLNNDRFIPRRGNCSDLERFKITATHVRDQILKNESYDSFLRANIFGDSYHAEDFRILSFSQKLSDDSLKIFEPLNKSRKCTNRQKQNLIPQSAEKVLDAPGLSDDHHLKTMSWSRRNTLAVALGSSLHLLDVSSNSAVQLFDLSENANQAYISSVEWAPDGLHLSVGLSTGEILIWETINEKLVRKFESHTGRVGTLDWDAIGLCSGSQDGSIQMHDLRVKDHMFVKETEPHGPSEIHSIQWASDGMNIASGGGDCLVNVWDVRRIRDKNITVLHRLPGHQDAIADVAWCPFQSYLLASCGDSLDCSVKVWNVTTGKCSRQLKTENQICKILWSKTSKSIVTCHGGSMESQLCIWKFPLLVQMAGLQGHLAKAGQVALSPDGSMVVTGGDDETLRFWNVFPDVFQEKSREDSKEGLKGSEIR